MRRTLALLVAALVTAACSSGEIADQGDRSRTGQKNAAEKAKGSKKGSGNKKGGVQDEIDDAADPGSAAGEEAPDDFGGADAPSSGIDPSLARAAATLDDAPDDAKKEGIAPTYTEAVRATIQGLGEDVRITMRFADNVPRQVQKDQYMVVAVGITGRKKEDGVALGATCNEKGWTTYAGAKDQRSKFPGTFEIKGTEIVMTIPWSFVKGPRAFEWYASTGWYGMVANQTHWSFDSIPNNHAGKFPN